MISVRQDLKLADCHCPSVSCSYLSSKPSYVFLCYTAFCSMFTCWHYLHHVLMVMIPTSFFLLVLVFLGLRCCLSSVLSGCFPSSLLSFLSYVLSESHRTGYLKRSCKVFFSLFSSGFDRTHCGTSLSCISIKTDCLHLLLEVFEQTWSDLALQKAFRVLAQVFRPSLEVAMSREGLATKPDLIAEVCHYL